ncbi:MAG TPA: SDR family NAD(P)-dependent oxidoreductase [Streptosporangiaceae bacterium]
MNRRPGGEAAGPAVQNADGKAGLAERPAERDDEPDHLEASELTQRSAPGAHWTTADVGDQAGRVAVITGASSGIGLEAAKVLAARGAAVVLACRDTGKGKGAAEQVAAAAPAAQQELIRLDLASLASVREAAAQITAAHQRIDLLINNAGVMMPPYGRTEDGFELQIGTNHLGHFALTGLLLGSMLQVAGSRVVTVSSNGHRAGRIHFDDLNFTRRYTKMAAYGQSKLANLMFTYELQRRLSAAGEPAIAVAAHPGTARTELTRHSGAWMTGPLNARLRPVNSWLVQDAVMGALPTLRAATDPDVHGGDYYGPDGLMQFTGYPVRVRSSTRSHDAAVQRRLWAESEQLTGVTYPV